MILVKSSFEILYEGGSNQLIELAGRTCYKSEDKMTADSADAFVEMVTKRGHHSVIEHSMLTVKFIIDRGVSHELVRHRLCAFSQESTRYCNYKGGVTFVIPSWMNLEEGKWDKVGNHIFPLRENLSFEEACELYDLCEYQWFLHTLMECEMAYIRLLSLGWTAQQARSVLPNSLKTEIVVTANFREWRHILRLRTSKAAHPQMREIMIPLLAELQRRIPILFDDIKESI
jgi:thymidylate synthase (FAD)